MAVAGGFRHSLYVKRDGTLWAMGWNLYGQLGLDTTDRLSPVQVTSDVVAVAGGAGYSLFVKRDGTLWATGTNPYGELGLGDVNQRTSPVQVFFQDSANQPTTALVVATLPKMPNGDHSLAIAAPAP